MYDIQIKNLSVYYDDVCALSNINLDIKPKQFLGIIGPNGGGKTTLLKILLGLLKPTSGYVKVKDSSVIGYVPQFTSFDKNFPISVIEVILMGKLSTKIKFFYKYGKDDIEEANIIMDKLGISSLKDRQIGGLSGGQLQKVLIARALINNPSILILDEPTASIDAKTRIEIYDILKGLNQNMTILIVSHDIEDIIVYVDSIACLNNSLHYHQNNKRMSTETFNKNYGCPVKIYLNNDSKTHCSCCEVKHNVK